MILLDFIIVFLHLDDCSDLFLLKIKLNFAIAQNIF